MYDAAVGQDASVALEEIRRGEAFRRLLHLRVAERKPYLSDFSLREETVDELDVRPQECGVGKSLGDGFAGTVPHARSLDIDADEGLLGEAPRHADGVLPAPATELEYYPTPALSFWEGMPSAEEILPMSANLRAAVGTFCCVWRLRRSLNDIRKGLHFRKLAEFTVSHRLLREFC